MLKSYLNHIVTSFRLHPAVQLTTVVVLTGTFVILSSFMIVKSNVDNLIAVWGNKVQLNVYLKDNISKEEKAKISKNLEELEGFEPPEYISKEMAAENFKSQMASYAPDLLSSEEFGNPLPASYEVALKASVQGIKPIELLKNAATQIMNFSGVDDVSYGQGWIESYSQFVGGFKKTSYSFLTLLLVGVTLVVGNSIKSSVAQRAGEIEVLELVGATNRMIRAPYLVEGAVLGFCTSLLAVLVSYALFSWQVKVLAKEFSFLGAGSGFEFLTLFHVLMLLLLGSALGALGAFISVSRINTGWAAANRSNGEVW